MSNLPATHVATTDIGDMLNPVPGRRQSMKGFDDEFVDIADYIIRITDRIWHERKIDLCLKYYAEDSVIHTLTGDIISAKTVEKNTLDTIAAFPDRTLDGDNVIWSGDEDEGFYSSHLITSHMTNEGPTEFGDATGLRARIRTIADCICVENKIVEEWLVRDNASLVQQLGFDLTQTAQQQAQNDKENDLSLINTLQDWRATVAETAAPPCRQSFPAPEKAPEEFANAVLGTIWAGKQKDRLANAYDFRVGAHMTAGRELYGTVEYAEYLSGFHQALSNIQFSVDHIADIPYLGDARDIAVRWTCSAAHTGDGVFGTASGAPIFILGVTHWRVMNGRIREEWTVFDELAVLRQIESYRLGT